MSNHIFCFINFYRIIKEKGSVCPFAILNTNRSSEHGAHWLSILDIHLSKQLFLLDSYGFTGFKTFIIDDNKNIINKILYSINKFNKKDDDIVTLISLKFSVDACEDLNRSELAKLSTTAADLSYLINEFGKLHNIKNAIAIYLVHD